MIEHARNSSGTYAKANISDPGSAGLSTPAIAININRNTGLFYAQENNVRVVEFSKDNLEVPVPVPIPSTLILFGSGLVGLIQVKRNKKAA